MLDKNPFVIRTLARPAASVSPSLLISNLNRSSDTALTVVGSSYLVAQCFRADENGGELQSVVITLASNRGSACLDLYSNSLGKPGKQLARLGHSGRLTTSPANIAFVPDTSVTLEPDTAYWLVLRSLDESVSWWKTFATKTIGSGCIPAPASGACSFNAGVTWNTHPLSSGPQRFEVHLR